MTPRTSFPVIIPAAGIGSRMAAKQAKQYLIIHQKTILEHTIAVFLSHCEIDKIVVVLHPEDRVFQTLAIANHPQVFAVVGGIERVDSVLAGLHFISQQQQKKQFVLVHDAARPCIKPLDISRLIRHCTTTSSSNVTCGAILACPVADTIKRARTDKTNLHNSFTVDTTVERSLLWQAQTPQMFNASELILAIETSLSEGKKLTDESSAMENVGKQVMLIEGPSSNIKITKPSDLALATYYLSGADKINTQQSK